MGCTLSTKTELNGLICNASHEHDTSDLYKASSTSHWDIFIIMYKHENVEVTLLKELDQNFVSWLVNEFGPLSGEVLLKVLGTHGYGSRLV